MRFWGGSAPNRGSSAPCLPPNDPTGGLGGVEGPPVPYPIRFPHSRLLVPICPPLPQYDLFLGGSAPKRGSSAPCLTPDDPTRGLGGFEGPPVPYPIRFPHSLLTDPQKSGDGVSLYNPPRPQNRAPQEGSGGGLPLYPPPPPQYGILGGVSPKKGEFCPLSAP